MSKPTLWPRLDGEEWRDVDGLPYAVSNFGRVMRLTGGSNNAKPGRILKAATDKDGYHTVRLCLDGAVHSRKVHVLVCCAFNGPKPFPSAQVRHRDGTPAHNFPSNLCWGTAFDNATDRDRHGRTPRGEESTRALLTQKQAEEIRARMKAARAGRMRVPRGTRRTLAVEFGLSVHGLATVASGRGYRNRKEATDGKANPLS